MPLIGLEPIRNYNSMDFKSIVSTNSTTVARNDIWKGERVVMGYSAQDQRAHQSRVSIIMTSRKITVSFIYRKRLVSVSDCYG